MKKIWKAIEEMSMGDFLCKLAIFLLIGGNLAVLITIAVIWVVK